MLPDLHENVAVKGKRSRAARVNPFFLKRNVKFMLIFAVPDIEHNLFWSVLSNAKLKTKHKICFNTWTLAVPGNSGKTDLLP